MIVEYLGGAPTARDWVGVATGCVYRFGGDKRTGYADARDAVKWITARKTNGAEAVFRVVE